MELIKGFDSNYRYVLVAARRARQLQSGAPALVKIATRKPCKIAQAEIDAGLVSHIVPAIPAKPLTPAEAFFDGGTR